MLKCFLHCLIHSHNLGWCLEFYFNCFMGWWGAGLLISSVCFMLSTELGRRGRRLISGTMWSRYFYIGFNLVVELVGRSLDNIYLDYINYSFLTCAVVWSSWWAAWETLEKHRPLFQLHFPSIWICYSAHCMCKVYYFTIHRPFPHERIVYKWTIDV